MHRNTTLDCLKGLAAIFVVFIHAQWPQPYGKFIAHISLFAVPLFFLTSGYFSHDANKVKLQKSIVYICCLLLICYSFNLLRLLWQLDFKLTAFITNLTEQLTISHLMMWMLFNQTTISGVAWFLFALLYCYVFKYLMGNIFAKHNMKVLVLCMIIGGVLSIIRPYSGWTSLGWISCGLPFFIIGDFFRNYPPRIKKSQIFFLSALGFIFLALDFWLRIGLWFPSAYLASTMLFVFAISNPSALNNCLLTKMGSRYAFLIYILHPIVIHIVNSFGQFDSFFQQLLFPMEVLLLTLCVTSVYYRAKNIITHIKWDNI